MITNLISPRVNIPHTFASFNIESFGMTGSIQLDDFHLHRIFVYSIEAIEFKQIGILW